MNSTGSLSEEVINMAVVFVSIIVKPKTHVNLGWLAFRISWEGNA